MNPKTSRKAHGANLSSPLPSSRKHHPPLFAFLLLIFLAFAVYLGVLLIKNHRAPLEIALDSPSPLRTDALLIKTLIREGEFSEKEIRITNIAEREQLISAWIEGSPSLASIDRSSFTLGMGQTQVLTLSFSSSSPSLGLTHAPGIYIARLHLKSEGHESQIPLIIEIESAPLLFDSNVNPVSLERGIARGSELSLDVRLFNLQGLEAQSVGMEYSISDLFGHTIFSDKETVVVKTQASFYKSIQIPRDLALGTYIFSARTSYAQSLGTSTYVFEVMDTKTPPSAGFFVSCATDPLCAGISLTTILLFFAFVAYLYLIVAAFFYERFFGIVGRLKKREDTAMGKQLPALAHFDLLFKSPKDAEKELLKSPRVYELHLSAQRMKSHLSENNLQEARSNYQKILRLYERLSSPEKKTAYKDVTSFYAALSLAEERHRANEEERTTQERLEQERKEQERRNALAQEEKERNALALAQEEEAQKLRLAQEQEAKERAAQQALEALRLKEQREEQMRILESQKRAQERERKRKHNLIASKTASLQALLHSRSDLSKKMKEEALAIRALEKTTAGTPLKKIEELYAQASLKRRHLASLARKAHSLDCTILDSKRNLYALKGNVFSSLAAALLPKKIAEPSPLLSPPLPLAHYQALEEERKRRAEEERIAQRAREQEMRLRKQQEEALKRAQEAKARAEERARQQAQAAEEERKKQQQAQEAQKRAQQEQERKEQEKKRLERIAERKRILKERLNTLLASPKKIRLSLHKAVSSFARPLLQHVSSSLENYRKEQERRRAQKAAEEKKQRAMRERELMQEQKLQALAHKASQEEKLALTKRNEQQEQMLLKKQEQEARDAEALRARHEREEAHRIQQQAHVRELRAKRMREIMHSLCEKTKAFFARGTQHPLERHPTRQHTALGKQHPTSKQSNASSSHSPLGFLLQHVRTLHFSLAPTHSRTAQHPHRKKYDGIMEHAQKAYSLGNYPLARSLYTQARDCYLSLDYHEKKEVFSDLKKFYALLAKQQAKEASTPRPTSLYAAETEQ